MYKLVSVDAKNIQDDVAPLEFLIVSPHPSIEGVTALMYLESVFELYVLEMVVPKLLFEFWIVSLDKYT